MSWQNGLTPEQITSLQVNPQTPSVNDGGAMAARLSQMYAQNPWVKPETLLALAKSNASPNAVDAVGYISGTQAAQDSIVKRESVLGDFLEKPVGALQYLGLLPDRKSVEEVSRIPGYIVNAVGFGANWLGKGLSLLAPAGLEAPLRAIGDEAYSVTPGIKKSTRYLTAGLDVIPEYLQYAESQIFSMIPGNQIEFLQEPSGGFWDSTSIGQLLANPEDQGSGYLISSDLREAQAREARARRGEINGSAFTIGRGLASTILRPDTEAYNYISGLVDAVQLMLIPDPTKYVAKGLKVLQQGVGGSKLVPLVSEAGRNLDGLDDAMLEIRKLGATATPAEIAAAEMGLTKSLLGGGVDLQKFTSFMKTNPAGREIVDRLINQVDAGEIFQKTFKGEISPEIAYQLSKASTENQVIATLSGAWSFDSIPMNQRIRYYEPGVGTTAAQAVVSRVRGTRLLAEVPDELLVVHGTTLDNVKSVKTFVNAFKAAGATKEEVVAFREKVVSAFREGGSPTEIHETSEIFKTLVMKTLVKNGIKQEVGEQILNNHKSGMEMMRSYFKNKHGINTDNGFMHAMLALPEVKASMPAAVYNDLLRRVSTSGGGYGLDMAFDSAIQHSDLLNRTMVLPDTRALRRLTRNPLLTKVLTFGPGRKTEMVAGELVKKPIIPKLGIPGLTSKRSKVEIITDRDKWHLINSEQAAIERAAVGRAKTAAEQTRLMEISTTKNSLIEPTRVLTGETAVGQVVLELYQSYLWKPFALMTGGYAVRNAIDAQVRMTFGGEASLMSHPLEYISMVLGRGTSASKRRDILGNNIMGRGSVLKPDSEIAIMKKDLADRISSAGRVRGMSSADYATTLRKMGVFVDVNRAMPRNGMILHTDGVVQQLKKLWTDPLNQKAARSLLTNGHGASTNNTVRAIVSAIKGDPDVYRSIEKLFAGGIEGVQNGNTVRFAPQIFSEIIDGPGGQAAVDDILKVYAKTIVEANATFLTGQDEALTFIAGYNHTPFITGTGEIEKIALKNTDVTGVNGVPVPAGGLQIGLPVLINSDGRTGIVIKTSSRRSAATIVPTKDSDVLTKTRAGTQEVRDMVQRVGIADDVTPGLPRVVSREAMASSSVDGSHFVQLEAAMDKATRWFFISLNERSSRTLERSPVFRGKYYDVVDEHLDKLSPTEARKIIDGLESQVKPGESIGRYIGNDKIVNRLEEIAANPKGTGLLTADDLDEYAKMHALNGMEQMLFDASNTNNLKDILRIIVPFGNAWTEVVGNYLSRLPSDGIHMYRRFQQVYSGLSDADPEEDGRGYFFKDPQTNEMMFSFPFSPQLSKFITGGDYTAGLSAPIKRLSQGINVVPGIGPVAQFSADKFIKETPENDWVRSFLLPYGKPKQTIVPGWASKIIEGYEANPDKATGIYANTYFETLKAEANTGRYDLSVPAGVEALEAEAQKKAKWLTMMRGFSQFLGPTSGALEFNIPTAGGDQYVKEMIKEFHEFQSEDYDSAVERFLKLHGDNAALYVASKSESVQPGLETTDDFYDWTRSNKDLIKSYSRTANYLAPSFGEFDFKVLASQSADPKQRRQLDAREQIDLAQNRIGSSRYRAAKVALGPYPTKEQQERLAQFRVDLSLKYPGFKPKAEFVTNEYSNDLSELKRLIEDPRVGWNPAIPAIKEYLSLRDRTIAASGMKTLKSKKLTAQRNQLFATGEALARQNAYFARIWQRLLAQEVED